MLLLSHPIHPSKTLVLRSISTAQHSEPYKIAGLAATLLYSLLFSLVGIAKTNTIIIFFFCNSFLIVGEFA